MKTETKAFLINCGLSAAFYAFWIISGGIFAQVEALEDISIFIALPVYLAGCVILVRRTKKILFYPVATAVFSLLISAGIVIILSIQFDRVVNESSSSLWALFGSLGMAFIIAIFIVMAFSAIAVLFGISVLTSFIAKKQFDKYPVNKFDNNASAAYECTESGINQTQNGKDA